MIAIPSLVSERMNPRTLESISYVVRPFPRFLVGRKSALGVFLVICPLPFQRFLQSD